MNRKIFGLFYILLSFLIIGCSDNGGAKSSVNANTVSLFVKITFDGNGATSGKMDEINAEKGKPVTLSKNQFVKEGYTFSGWASSVLGAVVYQDSSEITVDSDTILYAVWVENSASSQTKYTITFNGNGNTGGSMESQTVTAGSTIKLPQNTFVKDNYVFAGWKSSVSGNALIADVSEIIVNSDIVFTAQWDMLDVSNKYTITLHSANSLNETETFYVNYGDKFKFPYAPFTKANSAFVGWSNREGGDLVYYNQEYINVNSNMELYALWDDSAYNQPIVITFDNNGGSGYDLNKEAIKNVVYLEPTNFTRDGYAFLGWSERQNAVYPTYYDGEYFNASKSMTLYAVWGDTNNDDVITITFDKEGGNCFIPSSLSAYRGEKIIVPYLDNCKKNLLIGIGYKDSNNNELLEGTEIIVSQDETVNIIWTDGSRKEYANQRKMIYGVSIPEISWVQNSNKAKWNSLALWYDTYQYNYFMCWAAVASNMLFWWYNNNKAYVDEYISLYGYDGPSFIYNVTGDEELFKYFTEHLVDAGNFPPYALNYFLNGNSSDTGGGFFKDVFKNKILTYKSGSINKVNFNYILADVIDNKKIASFNVTIGGPHVITFWGADYDNDGFIKKVYITNSNSYNKPYYNQNAIEYGDLEYCDITYESDKPYLACPDYDKTYISELYTFSLGDDIWREYLKK